MYYSSRYMQKISKLKLQYNRFHCIYAASTAGPPTSNPFDFSTLSPIWIPRSMSRLYWTVLEKRIVRIYEPRTWSAEENMNQTDSIFLWLCKSSEMLESNRITSIAILAKLDFLRNANKQSTECWLWNAWISHRQRSSALYIGLFGLSDSGVYHPKLSIRSLHLNQRRSKWHAFGLHSARSIVLLKKRSIMSSNHCASCASRRKVSFVTCKCKMTLKNKAKPWEKGKLVHMLASP